MTVDGSAGSDDVSRRAFVAAAPAGVLAFGPGGGDLIERREMNQPDPQALWDRAEVIEITSRIGIAADLGDWDAVRACFAGEVRVDYTSLNGGEPATVRADDLIAGWRGVLPGFEATQHVVSNHQVTLAGDAAECRSHFVATHRIGADVWRLGGHYHHRLSRQTGGWRVTEMTMTWTWEEGDRGLVQRAASRAVGGG